jgi:hypothetical protein
LAVLTEIKSGVMEAVYRKYYKKTKPCMMLPVEYHKQSMIEKRKVRLPVWQAVQTGG